MTNPTPEQMRTLADTAANLTVDNDWDATVLAEVMTALRAAADEVDRLRAVIENAPHAADCRAQFHGGDRYGNGGDVRYCICWKADAL